MSKYGPLPAVFLAAAARWCALSAAETGDVNGDGRLNIADVLYLSDLEYRNGPPPVAGSLDGLLASPCINRDYPDLESCWLGTGIFQALVYLESLRRSVEGSYPLWDSLWPEEVSEPPLDPDRRVQVELVLPRARGGASDLAEVAFRILSTEPILAFSLVLESGDILRVQDPDELLGWTPIHWRRANNVLGGGGYTSFLSGGSRLVVTPSTYLLSRGRFVVLFNLDHGREPVLAPGVHEFRVGARLPKGLGAGSYGIRVHPGSQVLLESGEVIAPVEKAGSLVVEESVVAGWDGGVPPFELDGSGRWVLGSIEFRLAGGDGKPPLPDQPVAEAHPGEEFSLRVQMRTEVPLNRLGYQVLWGDLDLQCAEFEAENIYRNPEDGRLYQPVYGREASGPYPRLYCGNSQNRGQLSGQFALRGSGGFGVGEPNYPNRVLEYFKPLNKWVDVGQFKVRIHPEAAGNQEIPLVFYRGRLNTHIEPMFDPYGADFFCSGGVTICGSPNPYPYWIYDLRYQDSFVRVLGEQEPPEAPRLGVRFRIGSALGSPGGLVEIPVFAAAKEPLILLRLALEVDPGALAVEAFDLAVYDSTYQVYRRLVVPRGMQTDTYGCTDIDGDGNPERCARGWPPSIHFFDADPSRVLIDINVGSFGYPGENGELFEIGRLLAWVLETPGASTVLRAGRVTIDAEDLESGGVGLLGPSKGKFGPAEEFSEGSVQYRQFLRGDGNADGAVDLSDAVSSLAFLFTGGTAPECRDGADADGNRLLEITDPIFLLGTLFLGEGALPPPYPDCGFRGGQSGMGCERTGCPDPHSK